MSAATTPINNTERSGQFLENLPLAAGVIIHAGALVAINPSGYAIPASDTASTKVVGVAQSVALVDTFDNSNGNAGDIVVTVKRAAYTVDNSTTYAVTAANVGGKVYVENDHTVASSSSHSISAGILLGFENGDITQPIVDVTLAPLG
jgi:hypothetical protein